VFERIIWIVLDSVGIGPLPDAGEYGDIPNGNDWRAGRNTIGHIARERARARRIGSDSTPEVLRSPSARSERADTLRAQNDKPTDWSGAGLNVPNLAGLGLGNIAVLDGIPPAGAPEGCYGKGATHSPGKDTTTGHWEMAGIWLDQAFPVYKQGFPAEILEPFERAIGRKTIGNKPASGTEIIKELGEEHIRTGKPIVYTSGDSVFQIAAHEEVIPIPELYRMCEIARRLLDGPHRVGRVIARPFLGRTAADFKRTERRHDYAVEPPRPMLLDVLAERGVPVFGVGKIHDIYNGRGVERYVTTKNNADGMAKIRETMAAQPRGLVFANLVDFDMLYGHRKDVEGFARSLEEFDAMLGPLLDALGARDLLMLTADHGCDPCPCSPSTDHSREYVPILTYSREGKRGVDLGTRATLADMGQTVAENFGGSILRGVSFLREL
jgi:phosphopentomutase